MCKFTDFTLIIRLTPIKNIYISSADDFYFWLGTVQKQLTIDNSPMKWTVSGRIILELTPPYGESS